MGVGAECVEYNLTLFNLRLACSFCRHAPSCQRNDVASCRWSSHAESASRRRRIADVQMPSNRRRPPLGAWAWAAIRQFRRQRRCSRMHLVGLKLVSPTNSSPRVSLFLWLCSLWGIVHSAAYYLTHTHTHTRTLTHSLTQRQSLKVDYYLLLLFLSLLLSVCSCMRSFQTDNRQHSRANTDNRQTTQLGQHRHTHTHRNAHAHSQTHNKPHIAHPHKQTECMLSCCLLRSSEAKLISFNLLFNYFIIYAPFRQCSAGSGALPTHQGGHGK